MSERAAFRVREVAAMLGVSAVRVQRWLGTGEVRGYKLGSLWFIPADEVARLRGYDAGDARAQRGEPLPAIAGREVGGGRHDARGPAVTIRKVEGRSPGEPAGAPR